MQQPNLSSLLQGLPVVFAVGIGFGLFLLYMAIKGAISFTIIGALKRVPAEHRKIEPAMVWLLMVPCFCYVWNFYVFRRVPASFQSAFAARGRTEFGDCGASLGLAYAIVELGFLVPWIGLIPWVAAWVMLILLLVRFHDYKEKLIQAQEAPLQNPNL